MGILQDLAVAHDALEPAGELNRLVGSTARLRQREALRALCSICRQSVAELTSTVGHPIKIVTLRHCLGGFVQAGIQGFTGEVQELKLLQDFSLALGGHAQRLVIIGRDGIVPPHDLAAFEAFVKR